ncbi:unnamed protein product [Periconia digitata]|uniref:Uncharacterized protein n=1 Tax=Periconia digitata TaxID=1303443 RepID=A0A9W4XF98_9PLEO|nr:unnamed protein product [Periconia digitata]
MPSYPHLHTVAGKLIQHTRLQRTSIFNYHISPPPPKERRKKTPPPLCLLSAPSRFPQNSHTDLHKKPHTTKPSCTHTYHSCTSTKSLHTSEVGNAGT